MGAANRARSFRQTAITFAGVFETLVLNQDAVGYATPFADQNCSGAERLSIAWQGCLASRGHRSGALETRGCPRIQVADRLGLKLPSKEAPQDICRLDWRSRTTKSMCPSHAQRPDALLIERCDFSAHGVGITNGRLVANERGSAATSCRRSIFVSPSHFNRRYGKSGRHRSSPT